MYGENLSSFSISLGVMFLPPAVMMMSFMRSVMLHIALGIEHPDVAGVQPAVGIDGLGGLVGLVQVAHEDARAAQQHLALCGDAHLGAGRRPRRRCRAVIVHRDARSPTPAALGLTVTLDHRYAQRQIPADQVGRDGRCAVVSTAAAVDADQLAHVI